MLFQRYIQKFKQILKCSTVSTTLQRSTRHPFYNNHEAITHFVRYLRRRLVTVGTKPINFGQRRESLKAMLFKFDAPNVNSFTAFYIGNWWQHKKDEFRKYLEEDVYQENILLGPDLAAAKFIIYCNGKVKFKNHSEWLDKTKKYEISKLPTSYDDSYVLEEIDLNGYPLRYEHLYYIFNLYYLKKLTFRSCKTIDDWALDKISAEYPSLEYLDISECENVTERGLEALYRTVNLKKLIITNFYGTAAFDLTCLMLEDVNPYLQCVVQQVKYKRVPAS